MIPLTVHHRTAYRYRRSVDLWPHRLMLCPRESRDLRVISCVVTVSPTAQVTWAHDVFGNAVATAVFQGASDSLVIDSVVELRLEATAWPIFNIAASAIVYPFRYADDEWADLGALTRQQYPDPTGRLATWARAFVRGDRTDTLALLKDLSAGVSAAIRYQSREDEGAQSPIENSRPRLGLLPGFRGPLGRSGAQSGVRGTVGLGLPIQPRSDASRIDGRRIDARLGRSLRVGRRVDQLRSDEPQRRRRESHSRRRRARHPADGAGLGRLCRKQRRSREPIG